jgi:hypothetical protein
MLGRIEVLLVMSAFLFAGLAIGPAVAADIAVDATGCLHISDTGASGTCDTKSKSLKVEVANGCKTPVRAQICLRGANHLWVSCASSEKLAPGEKFFGSSCDSDGDYTYWGCSQTSGSGVCGGSDLVGKATNTQK